ncbi:MAG: hypothetical protein A3J24_05110 [Deltaproteobacteria bacterium RIFCSPLOWO2_02_FULL_53_8]|nr:MAG: hypothetical protein A3J24_05110 [Deltaproteobacteria bacterium RIFCSPLOWO2_02_FULL_53_8]
MPYEEAYNYSHERTEPPTERSRAQARLEGRSAVSSEVSVFFVTLAGVIVLYYAGAWIFTGMAGIMQQAFRAAARPGEMSLNDAAVLIRGGSLAFVYLIIPLLALPIAGFLSQAAQSGFASTGRLTPQTGRLNPLENLMRMFSAKAGFAALKSAVKIALIGYAVYTGVLSQWPGLPVMADMDAATAAGFMSGTVFNMTVNLLWALLAIAVLDYAYERWAFERSIMVSREELKAEARESEGDPLVRARIREAQAEAVARKKG